MADNIDKKKVLKKPKPQQQNAYVQLSDSNATTNTGKQQQSQHQLQLQPQIQKKHSGPLDAAINELRRQEEGHGEEEEQVENKDVKEEEKPIVTTTTTTAAATTTVKAIQHHTPALRHHGNTHTHTHGHQHYRKRERWLLTRKTWKFMQDAGRKLLPDNVQNRKEDIPLIEAHFQEICGSEQRYLLWRRKVSFPGARRTSLRKSGLRKRLPGLRRHQQQRHVNVSMEQTADQAIDLLAKYLQLDDHTTTTTALLSSKTQQPHQTVSPSAQRPSQQQQQYDLINIQSSFSSSSSTTTTTTTSQLEQLLLQLRALSAKAAASVPATTTTTTTSSMMGDCIWLPKPELITRELLENKLILKQIYNALKRQQLHRQLSIHTTTPTILLRRTHSFNNLYQSTSQTSSPTARPITERKQPPRDLKLREITTSREKVNSSTNTAPLSKQLTYRINRINIIHNNYLIFIY